MTAPQDKRRMAIKLAMIKLNVELQVLDAKDRLAACAENGWMMSSTHELYDHTTDEVIALVEGTLDADEYLARPE